MKRAEIVVIGGGMAGLAAAVTLLEHGRPVTLLERRGRLGGRATSTEDPVTGEELDNGPHVLMGANRATRRFLRMIGAEDQVRFQTRLELELVDGERPFSVRTWALPPPLHLGGLLLGISGLRLRERLATFAVVPGLMARRPPEGTVEEWLNSMRQPETIRRQLWRPLALAVMNETPDRAAAAPFVAALRESLFDERNAEGLGLPTVPLGEIAREAGVYIEKAGGSVRCGVQVQRLAVLGNRVQGAILSDESMVRGETFVCAVPPPALLGVLPEEQAAHPFFASLTEIEFSPIVSIHIRYDRPVMTREMTGLVDRPLHWVFDRSRILGNDIALAGSITIVTSAARHLLPMRGRDLAALAGAEIRRAFPAAAEARLLHHRVIREPAATFSPTPKAIRLRPPAATPIENLFLAGDWTATGLPATIEGAVRSGFAAADLAAG